VLYFNIYSNMPIANGDSASNGVPLNRNLEKQDWRKAVELLKEYESLDGLDVHTLIDSKENGALTYNDFLVLPGYIGMPLRRVSCGRSDTVA
jgi:IMP dehydrogenase